MEASTLLKREEYWLKSDKWDTKFKKTKKLTCRKLGNTLIYERNFKILKLLIFVKYISYPFKSRSKLLSQMQTYFAKIYPTKIRASVDYAVSLEAQYNYW